MTSLVRADGPLGPEGSPIATSDYAVDFTRGTVLSASRVTGLSGAFSAIAEGAEGGLTNPASVAVRSAGSVDFWDYWLALGFTYPFENGDYYNDGNVVAKPEGSSFFFLNPGAYLQLWNVGFGIDVDIQSASVRTAKDENGQERELRLDVIATHYQVGSLFFDGNLVVGGGMQVLREQASGGSTGERLDKLLGNTGFGGEVGVLIRPNFKQWRVGASLYSSVKASPRSERKDIVAESLYLPQQAVRPWTGSLAFAYQFGKRPFNPRFVHTDQLADALQKDVPGVERDALKEATWWHLRNRMRNGWTRRYLLLTTELTLTGRVDNAVGVSSFLAGVVQRSGERITVTPRVAIETEPWPKWVKVRSGMYVEPSRFRGINARVHTTAGLDIRLFRWNVFGIWPDDYLWQVSAAIDVTEDYAAFSTSIGGWY
jgi:hypothetical protein